MHDVALGADVGAWFTSGRLRGTEDANLAHHRPHVPERLAQARDVVGARTGTDPAAWHLMRQVHGAAVAVVGERTPSGAEMRDVDVLVTRMVGRPLVVLAADCLPILVAGRTAVGAAHAGWRGLRADVPGALVSALVGLGERPEDLQVALGPAIGPCCYEVGPEVVAVIEALEPRAVTTTTDGAPSVDLRVAAGTRLRELGVRAIVGSEWPAGDVRGVDTFAPGHESDAVACTACEPGWFSHRRDPAAGRQAGIVVRRGRQEGAGG